MYAHIFGVAWHLSNFKASALNASLLKITPSGELSGLNADILKEFIKNRINESLEQIHFPKVFEIDKELIKKTNNIRYGCDSPIQNEFIKNKIVNKFIEKYGVDNPSKSSSIIEKIKLNNLKKYGKEWSINSDLVQEKIKMSNYL